MITAEDHAGRIFPRRQCSSPLSEERVSKEMERVERHRVPFAGITQSRFQGSMSPIREPILSAVIAAPLTAIRPVSLECYAPAEALSTLRCCATLKPSTRD